jgi:predicted ferric reductase
VKKSANSLVVLIFLITVLILGSLLIRATSPVFLWYLTRASGIISYLLLFLLTMTGMGITSGFIYNFFGPVFSWRLHRTYGITLVAFILIHVVTLAFDTTKNFSLADLFVPFYSQYSPIYMSMGIIGFWLFVLIIITSIVWVVKKYKAWRFIHYLAFPAFVLLFLHGVLIGTDTGNPIMLFVYWITGILVAAGLVYRLSYRG